MDNNTVNFLVLLVLGLFPFGHLCLFFSLPVVTSTAQGQSYRVFVFVTVRNRKIHSHFQKYTRPYQYLAFRVPMKKIHRHTPYTLVYGVILKNLVLTIRVILNFLVQKIR